MGQSRVTINDVAAEAGVSRAAAARALGGYGNVSPRNRTKVQEAARKLGYRTNQVARSLTTGRTRTIGVVGADIENPFFARAMRGIGDVAREHGFGAILMNTDEDIRLEREAVHLLQQHQVEGIIIAVTNNRDVEHLADAVISGTPVVLLDRVIDGLAASAVMIDNVATAREAVGHLLDSGHRRIGIVAELGNPFEAQWEQTILGEPTVDANMLNPSGARLLGYLEAHLRRGVAIDPRLVLRTGAYSGSAARRMTVAALQAQEPPTAIFAVDNLMSTGAYEGIREAGASIPEEVSFLAFDDLDWMSYVSPAISTVRQPIHEMGAEAARLLLARLEDPALSTQRRILSTELVIRESTRSVLN
ncbi:LacI family DNA-binding transcriptional regulator [Nesterenkonia suensis]